jgi:hypothetical protein
VTSREEVIGSEIIDHHPVKKVKITSMIVHDKKTTTSVFTAWRATDLHDLALRRSASDGSYDGPLEHVVLGKPDPKLLAFPDPPCKYDAMADTTKNAGKAPPPTTPPGSTSSIQSRWRRSNEKLR